MTIPALPPAESDLQVTITIPRAMVPYFDLIHQEVAPSKTREEYLSSFAVRKGREYLKQKQTEAAAQAMLDTINGVENALDELEGM